MTTTTITVINDAAASQWSENSLRLCSLWFAQSTNVLTCCTLQHLNISAPGWRLVTTGSCEVFLIIYHSSSSCAWYQAWYLLIAINASFWRVSQFVLCSVAWSPREQVTPFLIFIETEKLSISKSTSVMSQTITSVEHLASWGSMVLSCSWSCWSLIRTKPSQCFIYSRVSPRDPVSLAPIAALIRR